MAIYISTVILFLIGIFTSHVYSSCLQGELKSHITKYGNDDRHCVYKDIKVLPGSSFELSAPDCLDCKCTEQGLQCCGFGFAAGKIEAPPGCVAYNDACNFVFVKKDKPSESCQQVKTVKKNRKILINRRT